jgi:hypothetical protein
VREGGGVGGGGLRKKREKGRRGESDSEGEGTGRRTDQADYAAGITAKSARVRRSLHLRGTDWTDLCRGYRNAEA